jgi:hypothetical protein
MWETSCVLRSSESPEVMASALFLGAGVRRIGSFGEIEGGVVLGKNLGVRIRLA